MASDHQVVSFCFRDAGSDRADTNFGTQFYANTRVGVGIF